MADAATRDERCRRARAAMGRVLIVEDNVLFRNPLRASIAADGFDVLVAESAEAAEAVLAQGAIDFVVTDLGLPGMDGAALAARHPETPFVLMTGTRPVESPGPPTSPSTVRAWLVKPFELTELLAILHEAVEGGARARPDRVRSHGTTQ